MLTTFTAPAFAKTWYIENGDITISAGKTEGTNKVSQGSTTDEEDTDTVITNNNRDTASSHTVTIDAGNDKVEVTLEDVNIKADSGSALTSKGDVTLTLKGDNHLTGGNGDTYGGSGISSSGSLTISGGETDSLTAQGGSGENGGDGISSKDYSALLNDPNTPLVNRATQGVYPPASTVKPYVAVSALSAGVITRNTSLFDPGWWQLPGSEKRYRDWKKWGHGHLNVTKALEESADTYFYQVAYDMGIDRLSEWMSKFGYGHYTGIDLSEERSGNMPTREWKLKRFKKPWYQGDTIPVGIGQGYWTATPIQMNKALMILINDGVVKVPHLLQSTVEDGKPVPWVQPHEPPVGDIHSGYWEIAKDGMYGVANRGNGTAHKYFASAPYKIAAKSGTAQVFGLKANETYNAHRISERLRDHKLMTAFAPYNNPQVAVAMILENGGAGPAVGTIMRQILDHIMLGDNNTTLPSENPAVTAGEDQ